MKQNLKKWAGASLLMAATVAAQAADFTIKIANPEEGANVILTWKATETKDTVAVVNGVASLSRSDFDPQYVILSYNRTSRMLYLEPDKNLTISFDNQQRKQGLQFEGEGATVNTYLNKGRFRRLNFPDTKREEASFIQLADSLYEVNMGILKEHTELPAAFVKEERERLRYLAYGQLPLYPGFHQYQMKLKEFKASEAFYNKLKDITVIDGALLTVPGYKDFILNAVMGLMLKDGRADDAQQQFIDYMNTQVKDEAVKAYIVDTYLFNQVSNNGVTERTKKYIDYYHQVVKDAKQLARFDAMCAQWEKVKAGMPSPSFSCMDINGKMVSLADLKGKVVYIDVWATWCGPCRKELPHLKKLEEAYEGKNIAFVSISCDKDKKAWEKMVNSGSMKGIQLHMGQDRSFMDSYIIKGIPRFILIDQEGNIVNPDAPRPSDEKTPQLLDELLAK